MKNKKGFTLIEMLAVIVIIGLIILIVLPSVTRVMFHNDEEQYKNYLTSIESGALTYATKLKDNLGGSNSIGCVEITLDQLIREGYVKKFEDNKVTCTANIRLNNNRGKADVSVNISCIDRSGKTTFASNKIDSNQSCISYLPQDELSLLSRIGKNGFGNNGSTSVSGDVTFVRGNNPSNYVWYSGKLWRIVSYTNNYVKLVTDDIITVLPRNTANNIKYGNSEIDKWLTNIFLPTLKEPDKYLIDTVWDVSPTTSSVMAPNKSETVTKKVGLLNSYEASSIGSFFNDNYSFLLSNYVNNTTTRVARNGGSVNDVAFNTESYYAIRPAITMKVDNYVIGGDGSINYPYILDGNCTNVLNGTALNTRYSGEYLYIGNDLYRIVSISSNITKAIMVNNYKEVTFTGSSYGYNSSNPTFVLNNEYRFDLGNNYNYLYPNATWCNF